MDKFKYEMMPEPRAWALLILAEKGHVDVRILVKSKQNWLTNRKNGPYGRKNCPYGRRIFPYFFSCFNLKAKWFCGFHDPVNLCGRKIKPFFIFLSLTPLIFQQTTAPPHSFIYSFVV
ncbi:MAG: hypothetical protein ACI4V2_04745 [Alloprevotella sp.]